MAVPDVIGIRLDEAHNALKAKGFEKFEDQDQFGDRAILVDSNWVVLQQEPTGTQRVPTGQTITLHVGKIGEARTKKALPADSPVLTEMLAAGAAEQKRRDQEAAAKAATDAAAAAKQAAERKSAAAAYVNDIDPAIRLAIKNHQELAKLRRQVARGDVQGDALTLNVSAANEALSLLATILDAKAPSEAAELDAQHQQLMAAVGGFKRAALTLMSADSSEKPAALQRFDVVYKQARSDWNTALKSSYAAAGVSSPPLVH